MSPRPPFCTSSSRYIRAFLSKQNSLNLSRLPKLPGGTPPLTSRSRPGAYDFNVLSNGNLKAADDDFALAVRLEATAEKERPGEKGSQTVSRLPHVRMPNLDIRMVPRKLLVVREKDHSRIPSKDLKNQRVNFTLLVVATKAAVHRSSAVRIRIKRRIAGALDLIVRRGAFPSPVNEEKQLDKLPRPKVEDHKTSPKKSSILLHDPALADPKAWIIPEWAYVIHPKAEVYRMPLSDLVYQLRLGLLKANLKTRAWQDRYISSETGEFIPLLSKAPPTADPPLQPKPWGDNIFGLKKRNADELKLRLFRTPFLYPLNARRVPPNIHFGTQKP